MEGLGSRCACVSVGMGGTGPVTPTGSGSGPATLLPPTGSGSGSDLCPEERPGFGSACRLPEMTCSYGKQTCCGETSAEFQMECRAGEWNGFNIDTVCMDPSNVCANSTTDLCPEERPGFGSACRLPEMTCSYG